MLSGMTHGLHGHVKWLSKQVLPDLAEAEFLLRIGSIYGMEPTAATPANGSVSISGVNTTVCPAGTVWQRGDGWLYTQDADATISSGTATITVTAQDDGAGTYFGQDGNADVGTKLTLAAPVAGISSSATVAGDGLTEGTDVESIDAFRTRLLLRLRNPPKGGGPGDYVNWALEVAGVTRAWEYPLMNGLGTVGVRFVRDNDASIIPDAGEVADVQAYIDSVAPITADVQVVAPTALALDMTIELTPDTAEVREAVEAEVEDLLRRTAEPGSTVLLSQLNEAISIAEGETDHVLTVPAANVTHTANQIAVLGTITWV